MPDRPGPWMPVTLANPGAVLSRYGRLMPDWSYRTLFRPLLFRVPTSTGRDLALAAIGGLACLPGGRRVIEFMGHMRPPRPLRRRLGTAIIDSPVGLAPGIDPQLVGLPGVCRFGFGFVEVGPVTIAAVPDSRSLRDDRTETIVIEPATANPGVAAVDRLLDRLPAPRPAVIVRLATAPSADDDRIVESLARHVTAWSLPVPHGDSAARGAAWIERVRRVVARSGGRPVLAVLPADAPPQAIDLVHAARDAGAGGAIVGRVERDGRAELGHHLLAAAERTTLRVRAALGAEAVVVAAAGIHAPGDAERLVAAGADLVAVDSGLVFTGPGLAKRCNEILLAGTPPGDEAVADGTEAGGVMREKWPWTLVIGASMVGGGIMAMVIACTRVIMPYDEAMSGLTRTAIGAVSPRLLPFMTHDRVSLAGAMLAVGILFAGLAWYGVRRGQHWAERAVILPAGVGFCSFFSFLGFGYFDPLHAFVTAILFQFLLLAIVGRESRLQPCGLPDRHNDAAWRWSQWGQLGFIAHGATVLVAGIVITIIGMTTVFVPEDLAYLQLCAADLTAVPGLVPLVAHDRGTFGGMLMVAGLTMLLAALWGFRRGAGWLWWTLVGAGTVGYAVAIAVHHAVGYVDPWHLAPAYGGLAALWLAAAVSRPFLCGR